MKNFGFAFNVALYAAIAVIGAALALPTGAAMDWRFYAGLGLVGLTTVKAKLSPSADSTDSSSASWGDTVTPLATIATAPLPSAPEKPS